MVQELGSGFALDAHDSAVGMIRIRVETSHPAMLDGCNGSAVCGTERTVTTNTAGSTSEIRHGRKIL
jgi:hypothetical protein